MLTEVKDYHALSNAAQTKVCYWSSCLLPCTLFMENLPNKMNFKPSTCYLCSVKISFFPTFYLGLIWYDKEALFAARKTLCEFKPVKYLLTHVTMSTTLYKKFYSNIRPKSLSETSLMLSYVIWELTRDRTKKKKKKRKKTEIFPNHEKDHSFTIIFCQWNKSPWAVTEAFQQRNQSDCPNEMGQTLVSEIHKPVRGLKNVHWIPSDFAKVTKIICTHSISQDINVFPMKKWVLFFDHSFLSKKDPRTFFFGILPNHWREHSCVVFHGQEETGDTTSTALRRECVRAPPGNSKSLPYSRHVANRRKSGFVTKFMLLLSRPDPVLLGMLPQVNSAVFFRLFLQPVCTCCEETKDKFVGSVNFHSCPPHSCPQSCGTAIAQKMNAWLWEQQTQKSRKGMLTPHQPSFPTSESWREQGSQLEIKKFVLFFHWFVATSERRICFFRWANFGSATL